MADVDQLLLDLKPPEYSEEEKEKIIEYFGAARKDYIMGFFEDHNLPKVGTKEEFRARIQKAIGDGDIHYKDLINFIDQYVMGGKQHVCLYDGPDNQVVRWRQRKHVEDKLAQSRVKKYLNARLPLILPSRLALSSVQYSERNLKITCVQRRDFSERFKEFDKEDATENGQLVELRAYVHQVMRGVVVFRWDLITNKAALHMTQLPSGTEYEDIEEEFFRLVGGWLDRNWFSKKDLKPVVKKLHELERTGHSETRSQAIKYISVGGRLVMAQSPTARNSLLGEAQLDTALDNIKNVSVGHRGNFYWLPQISAPHNGNCLDCEVHTFIEGTEARVNFSTPNKPEHIDYVLQRVRALSQ